MTPLASYLANQLIARPKHRKDIWREPQNLSNLRSALHDTHFFEVTKCLPLFVELCQRYDGKVTETETLFEDYAFLPAPKTWIEWQHGSGNKIAVLLEELRAGDKPATSASATFFCEMLAQPMGQLSLISGDYWDGGGERYFPQFMNVLPGKPIAPAILSTSHIMLLLINTPKIVGRQQYMPNRGLERELTKKMGVGKFPLHAWTEIQLKVAKPPEIDDGEPHEAHLTGRRALHFCRKHVRIRLGRLEYVSAHWRGDPALGIKQSRYAVSP